MSFIHSLQITKSAWTKGILMSLVPTLQACIPTRGISKHWKPEYRKLREKKVIRIPLPDYDEERKHKDLSPEEMKQKSKQKGIIPVRPWNERQATVTSTSGIFEPYVPPEGDGKESKILPGAKQTLERIGKKGTSYMAVRKIRSYDEEFETKEFALQAQDIYIKAHTALASKDKYELGNYVTELAIQNMLENTHLCTMQWKFVKSLEAPCLVHARVTHIVSQENLFAQATVRLHTQQVLAIYNRFGHLEYGSELVAKDVLEYIVFEKHLPNQYGTWRLHAKIIPDWMPPREPIPRTYLKPPPPPVLVDTGDGAIEKSTDSEVASTPAMA